MSGHGDEKVEEARADEVVAEAVIQNIEAVSPTVRKLTLKLQEPEASKFTFFPGMWVDFYIPPIDKVGGYTIISLPEDLPNLELAVKVTPHPPAWWIGHKAKNGDRITLRAGGTFNLADVLPDAKGNLVDVSPGLPNSYPPQVDHLLLVAAGIGITPLYAMVLHWVNVRRQLSQGQSFMFAIPEKMTLIYSAKSLKELVFLDQLRAFEQEMQPSGSFRVCLHVTEDEAPEGVRKGRIQMQDLVTAVGDTSEGDLNSANVLSCICGPQQMADGISMLLMGLGLKPGQVRLEKWW